MINQYPIILAVDDDPNDLMFLSSAFTFIGRPQSIQSVCGGGEAIAYLNGEGVYGDRALHPYPNCILTDLKMPGIDGFDLLEFLRRKPDSALIRTVVLSGSQDQDDIKKAYELGAGGYLVKPSSTLDLRKIVKTLHDFWILCERPERIQTDERCPASGCKKLGDDIPVKTPGSNPDCKA